MKRMFDAVASAIGMVIISPFLLPVLVLIWLQDFHSPFYLSPRIGKGGREFKMVKLRSMIASADKSGVSSTSENDSRITLIGRFVRKFKLDELPQLWNIFKGDMTFVGPRPQVPTEVGFYTSVERGLLDVLPGLTDFSSIVFSDEGGILKDSKDPDLDYNQLIRPWKSRLGLLYAEKKSFLLDIKLIVLTLIALFSRRTALRGVEKLLRQLMADEEMIRVAKRQDRLSPFPPPGSSDIVTAEKIRG